MNEYRILNDKLPEGLASNVNRHLRTGWMVQGAPLSHDGALVQAVTRNDASFNDFATKVTDIAKEVLREKGHLPLPPGTSYERLKRLVSDSHPQILLGCEDEDEQRVMNLLADRLSIKRR